MFAERGTSVTSLVTPLRTRGVLVVVFPPVPVTVFIVHKYWLVPVFVNTVTGTVPDFDVG